MIVIVFLAIFASNVILNHGYVLAADKQSGELEVHPLASIA